MTVAPAERNTVFVSHANPEDNQFARWLSLQLANEGYPVWCDLTKLLGGEKFWEDIQDAIKNRTAKFLFTLSRHSNQKSGTLDELNCALGVEKRLKLRDFVITLQLDNLPNDEVYINIQRRNHINFQSSWSAGLSQLLEKLVKEQVPKNPNFSPETVCSWWRSQNEFSAEQGVLHQGDEHLSNWFPVQGLPGKLYRHLVSRKDIGKIDFETKQFFQPAVQDTELSFLSFAKASDFDSQLPFKHVIETSQEYAIQSILERTSPRGYSAHLTQLLRMAWERMMAKSRLPVYELSSRAKCFYFLLRTVKDDRLFFDGVGGKRTCRDVVGYSTRFGLRRYWHYGINAKPSLYPVPHYVVKGQVLFSKDGLKLWESKEKIAKARRSQCRNWWNDEWRDRMLAVMAHLADEEGRITLSLASDVDITLSQWPETFESPVSYVDPEDVVKEEDLDDYAFEEEEDDQSEIVIGEEESENNMSVNAK